VLDAAVCWLLRLLVGGGGVFVVVYINYQGPHGDVGCGDYNKQQAASAHTHTTAAGCRMEQHG
jgi:hypothetical protein